jgi:hypothetical protein
METSRRIFMGVAFLPAGFDLGGWTLVDGSGVNLKWGRVALPVPVLCGLAIVVAIDPTVVATVVPAA